MDVLRTERLTLRPLTGDDAPFMLDLLNDASFLRFIGDRGVHTLAAAQAYIRQGPIASYERFGFGLLLVSLADTGPPIGICGLIKRDTLEDVDVGFAFLPAYRSRGYGFEAASAVIEDGRARFGLSTIVAITNPGNEPSIRLLEKLGFAFDRMIRMPDGDVDLRLFRLVSR
jgi:RimJ/RimL family protein N-acetyltransferase